ncbi:MAG: alpha/beta hydrolase [Steroidobacter sp.]
MQPRSLARTFGAALLLLAGAMANAQPPEKRAAVKGGLTPADWAYTIPDGVTKREVTYYSDEVGCYAVLFLPRNFSANGKTPGVVLGHGWAGTHNSIEKYGARLAEKGLVAMVIDYRGWGRSDGFATLADRGPAERAKNTDDVRYVHTSAEVVIKRTRLIPMKQVEDVRSAISWLQGEPGVDPDRIGVWGSSFAAGNSIVVGALDARVKAISVQVPAISGKNAPTGAMPLGGRLLEDAIMRARTGQGAEFETGFSTRRTVDVETSQMVAEYRPFRYLKDVGDRPVQFIVAANEELFSNKDNAYAAAEVLTGPTKVIEVPNTTHFEMYIDAAFEISSNAAADWFLEHLGAVK